LEEADDEGLELVVVSGTAELFVVGEGGEVCEKGPSTSWCIVIGAGAERVAAMVVSGRSGGKTSAVDRTKFEQRVKNRAIGREAAADGGWLMSVRERMETKGRYRG
jgi:hypothetical protein